MFNLLDGLLVMKNKLIHLNKIIVNEYRILKNVESPFVDSSLDMANYNSEKSAAAIYKGICTELALTENQNPSTDDKEYYIVKYGDTLWGISRRFNTTVDKLVELNSIGNRNLIFVGQSLRIK